MTSRGNVSGEVADSHRRSGQLEMLAETAPPMGIVELMQNTHKNYDAKWFQFEQGMLLFRGNDQLPLNNGRGVCAALCRKWLRYGHNVPSRAFPQKMRDEVLEVVAKQQRMKPDSQSEALRKLKPVYGQAKLSPGALRWGDAEPEFDMNEHRISSQKPMTFRRLAYTSDDRFWTDCVDGMSHFHSGKNYVGFTWVAKEYAHAIALKEYGGIHYFFDPNGGILRFKTAKSMKDWLLYDLRRAREYSFVGLKVEVYDYKPKPKGATKSGE